MAQSQEEVIAFAQAMLKAAESGDYEKLRSFYDRDARLWFNTTEVWKTLDDHFDTVSAMRGKMGGLRYAEPRFQPFDGGYVQQFRAQADTPGGCKIDMPVCIVIRLKNGKIITREEYYDSAALTPKPAA